MSTRAFLSGAVSRDVVVLLNLPWHFQLISAAFETLIRINEADVGCVVFLFSPPSVQVAVVDLYTVAGTLAYTVPAHGV